MLWLNRGSFSLPLLHGALFVLLVPDSCQAAKLELIWRLLINDDSATVTTNAFGASSGKVFPFPTIPIYAWEMSYSHHSPTRTGRDDVAILQVRADGSLDSERLVFVPQQQRFMDISYRRRTLEDIRIPNGPNLTEGLVDSIKVSTSIRGWHYSPETRLGILVMDYETLYLRDQETPFRRPYRTQPITQNLGNTLCVESIYDDDGNLVLARLANLSYRGAYLAKGVWSRFYCRWITKGPGHSIVAAVSLPRPNDTDLPSLICADQLIENQKTLTLEDSETCKYFDLGGNKLLVGNGNQGEASIYELSAACEATRTARFFDPRYWIVEGAISEDGNLIALRQQVPNKAEGYVTLLDANLKILDRIEDTMGLGGLSFTDDYLVLGKDHEIFLSTREIRIYRVLQ